jgi:pilus assembly protein CpaE
VSGWRSNESGQASVELVAALPFVLLLAAVVWQLALAGHALLTTAHAARAAARAELVDRDGEAAARSVLPEAMERGLNVESTAHGVKVSVRMPVLHGRWSSPVRVAATSSLEPSR